MTSSRAVIRTPSAPGTDAKCECSAPGWCPCNPVDDACACEDAAYGFTVGIGPWTAGYYRISVDAPWSLHDGAYCKSGKGEACIVVHTTVGAPMPETRYLYVSTGDSNAPARNVLIEQVSATDTCP